MQLADFLSAVFFYLKVGENLNQNWIVENLNNAFSTWNGKLGELWGLVTTGPQTFKGGAVWSVMQTLHNGMVGIGYALVVLFFAISLYRGHIIARAAICFGNLELYFLAEQQQKYLLLT